MAGQADLGMSIASTLQSVGSDLQPLMRRGGLDRGSRNQFGLVEASLPPLRAIKRHRNDKSLVHKIQLSDGLAEHPAQHVRGGFYAVKFQQVYQFPQATVITPVRGGALKRTVDPTAYWAFAQAVVIANGI